MSQPSKHLDTSELVGFAHIDREIDLQSPLVANRCGAKIGETPLDKPHGEKGKLDPDQLPGFVLDGKEAVIDEEATNIRSGAKIDEP